MAIRFDPLLGKVRTKDIIPQVTSDPASPKSEEAWVLKEGGQAAGDAYGLLLALTQPGTAATYTFKYRTEEGTTVTASLS